MLLIFSQERAEVLERKFSSPLHLGDGGVSLKSLDPSVRTRTWLLTTSKLCKARHKLGFTTSPDRTPVHRLKSR